MRHYLVYAEVHKTNIIHPIIASLVFIRIAGLINTGLAGHNGFRLLEPWETTLVEPTMRLIAVTADVGQRQGWVGIGLVLKRPPKFELKASTTLKWIAMGVPRVSLRASEVDDLPFRRRMHGKMNGLLRRARGRTFCRMFIRYRPILVSKNAIKLIW